MEIQTSHKHEGERSGRILLPRRQARGLQFPPAMQHRCTVHARVPAPAHAGYTLLHLYSGLQNAAAETLAREQGAQAPAAAPAPAARRAPASRCWDPGLLLYPGVPPGARERDLYFSLQ